MTNILPAWIFYAGLGGTLFALIVATAQQKWQCRVFFMLALRFAIGWHFLFEGLYKINSHDIGITETNKPFTSEPYFKAAPTKFGGMMRKKFDDPLAVIQSRVVPVKPMTASEFSKLDTKGQSEACPEVLRQEFDAMLEATEENVKTEAANVRQDAKKAYDKELKAVDDATKIASVALAQSLKAEVDEEELATLRKLAKEDDVAKRKLIRDDAEKRIAALKRSYSGRQADLTRDQEAATLKANESLAKQEKAADEKASNFKAIAVDRIENAKIAYAAWIYGTEGRESKVKFTTGEAALTAPQRLAHLDWLRGEAKAAEDHIGSGIGIGNGVEVKHAAELRMEVMTAEAELARDSYALDIKKSLTGKDQEVPKPNSTGAILDKITMWFITIIGACILFGLFTRFSCVLAAGFLVMTYLTHPAVPWYPLPPNTEGNPLFINKNVIECLALLVIACYPTGRWLGLDAWVFCRCGNKHTGGSACPLA